MRHLVSKKKSVKRLDSCSCQLQAIIPPSSYCITCFSGESIWRSLRASICRSLLLWMISFGLHYFLLICIIIPPRNVMRSISWKAPFPMIRVSNRSLRHSSWNLNFTEQTQTRIKIGDWLLWAGVNRQAETWFVHNVLGLTKQNRHGKNWFPEYATFGALKLKGMNVNTWFLIAFWSNEHVINWLKSG